MHLLEDLKWSIYNDGKITWNILTVNRFFQKTTQINQNMSTLNHVILAPPSHKTEFINMQYHNSDHI